MSIDLKMPALSPTMEKGTLAKWFVKVGDSIQEGDILAEIETDKATMEIEAENAGVIAAILVHEASEDVPVGTAIAVLADAGEAIESEAKENKPEPVASTPPPKPATDAAAKPQQSTTAPTPAPIMLNTSVKATPLAKRVAAIKNIDLSNVTGSGPHGRIVKADLGLAPIVRLQVPLAANPTNVPTYEPPAGIPYETIKLTSMRKTIARRLTESKQTVPHFYLTAKCQLDALLKLRSDLNASLADSGIKLSVNDFLIKALAAAMKAVPGVNVQFSGDQLYQFNRVDISMAVAIDGGLITPVIKNADKLSLSAIAHKSKALAASAKEGNLTPEEYQGGTASISNLGMFGIDEMFPVINPPQAMIMGIGAGIKQPWDVGGKVGLATIMAATASFDHRAIDGAMAAEFMAAFRERIETPLRIIA